MLIDHPMRLGIVPLDMIEICRLAKGGVGPVAMSQLADDMMSQGSSESACGEATHVPVQGWIAAADFTDVALEVLDVDDVEADESLLVLSISFEGGRSREVCVPRRGECQLRWAFRQNSRARRMRLGALRLDLEI